MKNSPKCELTLARFLNLSSHQVCIWMSSYHWYYWHTKSFKKKTMKDSRTVMERSRVSAMWLTAVPRPEVWYWKAAQHQGASLMETRLHTNRQTKMNKCRMKDEDRWMHERENKQSIPFFFTMTVTYSKEFCGRVLKDWRGRSENRRDTIVRPMTGRDRRKICDSYRQGMKRKS